MSDPVSYLDVCDRMEDLIDPPREILVEFFLENFSVFQPLDDDVGATFNQNVRGLSQDSADSTSDGKTFVRNQNTAHHQDKVIEKYRASIGRVEINGVARGSGVMLSSDRLLTCAHVIDDASNDAISVRFGVYEAGDRGDPGAIYGVEDVQRCSMGNDGIELNIVHDGGDLALLKLKVNNGRVPCNVFLTIPANPMDALTNLSSVYFLGYTGATHLRYSKGFGLNPTLMSVSDKDLTGRRVSHGARDGTMESHELETGEVVFSPAKKAGRRSKMLVSPDNVKYEVKKTKSFQTYANPETITAVLPPIFGEDHIILALKTAEGSSGGVYFTSHGEIIAIHCGAIPEELHSAFGLPTNDVPHIAILPNAVRKYTFWSRFLRVEAKKAKSGIAKQEQAKQALLFKAALREDFPLIYGKVHSENDEKYTIDQDSEIFVNVRAFFEDQGWLVSYRTDDFFVARPDENNCCEGFDERQAGSYAVHYHIWFAKVENRVKTVIQYKAGNKHYRVFLKVSVVDDKKMSLSVCIPLDPHADVQDDQYVSVDSDGYSTPHYKNVFEDVQEMWGVLDAELKYLVFGRHN